MDPRDASASQAQVEAFGRRHRTGLVALLFTDMVGSTALKQQLGDHAGAQLIEQHHALVRATLQEFPDGEELSTAGDSFFLVFATPSAGVKFALVLQQRLRELSRQAPVPVQDRMGLHLGEVLIQEADQQRTKDLIGLNVDLGARVMGLAQGGQILLTRALFDSARQALKGEDIAGVGPLSWLNHGLYQLKGIEEAVEVCEVGEVGAGPLRSPATTENAQRQVRPDEEPVLGWRPAVGQAVSNTQWVLEKKLGEGGFGEVWLGRHQQLKERRVFKFCFRADRVRSLKRELTLFRLIRERIGDHPNIVALREVYFDAPPFYVEMDYVAGQDLRTWCEAQGGMEKVPLETRLEIVAQAAEGLQAAHDAGVIHRDVKPGNILVSQLSALNAQPTAKLTDFGIGQVVSEEYLAGITRTGFTQTILADSSSSKTGTQLYMAPELLAGKPASTRSDTYSLGVVLYQVLVGDFTRPITTDWADSVSDPLVRDDLKHCFAGNPQDRFAGAGQLAKNLRALPERRATLERQQAELAARERAAYRRGIVRTASLAALMVVLFAWLAAAAFHQSRTAKRNADRAAKSEAAARRRAYASEMNLAQQALALNNLGRARELLDRQRAQPGAQDLRGWEWRYLWQQCQSDALCAFCQRTSSIFSLAVSHDGKWLAVGEQEAGVLSVWDLGARRENALLRSGEGEVRVAFSPVQPLLAFSVVTPSAAGDRQRSVRLWNPATKEAVVELPLSGDCAGLTFSGDGRTLVTYTESAENQIALWRVPDGRELAAYPAPRYHHNIGTPWTTTHDASLAAYETSDGRVRVVDLATGRERWVAKAADDRVTALAFSPDGRILASGPGWFESTIRLWDVTSGKEIGRLDGHRGWITALIFWPDGKTLASASADQTIRLWDMATLRPLRTLRGHRQEVWRLALLPDHTTLVSGGKDGSVFLWDTAATRQERTLLTLPVKVAGWGFAPDSKSVVTVSADGRLARWGGADFQEIPPVVETHTNFLRACIGRVLSRR